VFKSEVLQVRADYKARKAILETVLLSFKSMKLVLHWMGLYIVVMRDLKAQLETLERLELQQQ
jgi:hypothetical protein